MSQQLKGSVNLIIHNDKGELLFGRRANTGWKDGWLSLFGGHIEDGETPTQAAIREAKEELDMDLAAEDLSFICAAPRNVQPMNYVAYVFMIDGDKHPHKNNEPEKCTALEWHDPENLPEQVIEDFVEIIQDGYLANVPYVEIGY